jgi:hypothetical protein
MDLHQTKLTKREWEILEIPVSNKEKRILKLIQGGIDNIDYNDNYTISLLSFMKISDNVEYYFDYQFDKYFKKIIEKMCKKYKINFNYEKPRKLKKIKTSDKIRMENAEMKLSDNKENIFEFILLDIAKKILKDKELHFNYYTLTQLLSHNIYLLNTNVIKFCNLVLEKTKSNIRREKFIKKSHDIIERNELLYKYADIKLYDHQKEMFSAINAPGSSLVMYKAPTGTGKTMTPVGLLKKHRIIFVCAAKHIGLQLAKACISLEIPIGIAFGCKDPGDIRLHYFAAKEFVKNRRTGHIFRVDNSVGDKVEIIISDIQSYLPAMNYMMAFNKPEDLIWFWDEPTITLDYEEHEFHSILEDNWKKNKIPNVVLSSATLPTKSEISSCIMGHMAKFKGVRVYDINSYDCKKTIPLLDKDNNVVLPHLVYPTYKELKKCLDYVNENKTILRHFDVNSIVTFILYVNKQSYLRDRYKFDTYFENISEMTVMGLKLYYLKLLKAVKDHYADLYLYFAEKKEPLYNNTIKITTSDAYTLTDGPTIYLTNNVEKIMKIYLRVCGIPEVEYEVLKKKIEKNNEVYDELDKIEKDEYERTCKLEGTKGDKALDKNHTNINSDEYKQAEKYQKRKEELRRQLTKIELDEEYIPNRKPHLRKYHDKVYASAFTCDIDEQTVTDIMGLKVEDEYKILLMLGIGVFIKDENVDVNYLAIMKGLAEAQKLYVILASTDYIYGTNYQFCHGYISKDLENMTQEKMIQAFGRVGRSDVLKDYSIRLRSDVLIHRLLEKSDDKPEVINMNRLFG